MSVLITQSLPDAMKWRFNWSQAAWREYRDNEGRCSPAQRIERKELEQETLTKFCLEVQKRREQEQAKQDTQERIAKSKEIAKEQERQRAQDTQERIAKSKEMVRQERATTTRIEGLKRRERVAQREAAAKAKPAKLVKSAKSVKSAAISRAEKELAEAKFIKRG